MQDTPHRITVHRRLRPLRLAFLLRPDDNSALARVFEINTCLWGGLHNAIIPVFRRTPDWWTDKPLKAPSAADIVLGYLGAFEPDFIVRMDDSLTIPSGIEQDRVIGPSDILNSERDEPLGYGVAACDIFHDLYSRTYRFVQRHPRTIGLPTKRKGRYELFTAAFCGCFPADNKLSYFARTYREAFDAVDLPISPETFGQLLTGKITTPLQISSSNLNVRHRGWRSESAIFVLDINNPRDLIDFWNLRALGKQLYPIPIQWQANLLASCSELIRWHYRPDPSNPKFMRGIELIASRSLQFVEVSSFIKNLSLPGQDALIIRHYPRIWDEWARDKDGVIRCPLEAASQEDEVLIEKERIRFQLASPRFETGMGSPNTPIWANVVHLRYADSSDEVATVLPEGMPKVGDLLDSMQFHEGWTRVTSEGLVSLCRYAERTVSWRLRDGVSVFREWLASRGFDSELSGSGRICLQMIRRLGGIFGIGVLANADVLHLLNKMAHGLVETETDESEKSGRKPRVRGRTASWAQWWGILRKPPNNDRWAEQRFSRLIDRGVLRIGLKLP